MNSLHKILLFLALCIFSAESADPLGNFCDIEVSEGSKILSNIDGLLPELVLKTPSTGFVTASYGKDQDQDQVYGLAQCRGDVSTEDCSSCIKDAAKQIRSRCPTQADARIWYDYCFLRYSNKSTFIGEIDTSHGIYYFNVDSVNDPDTFNKQLGALMDQIREDAVEARNGGLGKGDTQISPFLTLYALVQCTRDLSPIDCAQCVAIAVGNFPNFCENKKGCRALYSSCYVRYELYPFFFPLGSNNTLVADQTVKIVASP